MPRSKSRLSLCHLACPSISITGIVQASQVECLMHRSSNLPGCLDEPSHSVRRFPFAARRGGSGVPGAGKTSVCSRSDDGVTKRVICVAEDVWIFCSRRGVVRLGHFPKRYGFWSWVFCGYLSCGHWGFPRRAKQSPEFGVGTSGVVSSVAHLSSRIFHVG
jgi:hypothetical protein